MQNVTIGSAIRAGGIAGLLGAGLNNVWSILAQAMGSVPPPGFPIAVTVSSVFPMLIAAVGFFAAVKLMTRGRQVYQVLAIVLTLYSLYPLFTLTPPVGTSGFIRLVAPMHGISGMLATWGIPRLVR